jgi:hypoxanthine phosphoribosyltransferase
MPKAYEKYLKEVLITETDLQNRIAELGEQINEDYRDVEDLLLVCILKGGVMFLSDLSRHIDMPHAIDFLSVSSYGEGVRDPSGHVRIDMDLSSQITGMNVLIVEDIIDSGYTLSFVMNMLQARHPKTLKLCTLLDKPERREVDITVNYVGFAIPNKFVYGYGLDLDEKFRNLPFIGVVDLDVLEAENA